MDTRLGVLLWNQATSWSDFESAARRVDSLGYDHLWACADPWGSQAGWRAIRAFRMKGGPPTRSRWSLPDRASSSGRRQNWPHPRPHVHTLDWSWQAMRATEEGVVEGGAVRAYPPGPPGGRGVDPRARAPAQRAQAGGPPGPGLRGPATAQGRPAAQPALGPHADTILRWLTEDRVVHRKQRHTARRIWERLVDEQGADLAGSTVRRYVRERRRELDLDYHDVAIVAHHLPGEEGQVDFGLADVIIGGEKAQVAIFELRLSHSGTAVHIAYGSEGEEAFFEGHVIAFARLGGVHVQIRYDNARALVARVLRGRNRTETERFIALRSHCGFDSFFCIPGEEGAHEKGGIEGEVGRSRRRHFVPMPKARTLAELNRRLEAADKADLARHIGARRLTVGAMGETDRAALRPLPAEPFDPARVTPVRVDTKARVCVRRSFYSVPARFGGRRLSARIGGTRIEVTDAGRVVASHERSVLRGSQTIVLDHYLEILARKPGAMPGALATHQARETGVLTAAHEAFWARARRKFGDAGGTRASAGRDRARRCCFRSITNPTTTKSARLRACSRIRRPGWPAERRGWDRSGA
jgi:transposase